MPIDPEKFKHDSRSPRELAKAILDHPLESKKPSQLLREQLSRDRLTQHEVRDASTVFWALKHLEEDVPLESRHKDALSHALEVIAVYKNVFADARDETVELLAAKDHGEPLLRGADRLRKRRYVREHEDAISHFDSIETLVRTLTHKLGISLREPGRRK